MMVVYVQDSNSIMLEPKKSKEGTDLTMAYKVIKYTFKDRGLKPKIHILDNECSNTLKTFMAEEEELFQMVPPDIHRINESERYIQNVEETFHQWIINMYQRIST